MPKKTSKSRMVKKKPKSPGKPKKGKESIYTGIIRKIKGRNKAIEEAGGGKPGRRVKATETVGRKKKAKKKK